MNTLWPTLIPVFIAAIALVITAFTALTSAKRGDVDDLTKMLNQYRAENKDQTDTIERLQAKVDTLQEGRTHDQKTIADLQCTTDAQALRITAMEAALTEGQKQIVDLQLAKAELERQLARRDQTIAHQATRIEDLEASKAELELRIAALERENADLRTRRFSGKRPEAPAT